jgi:adenylate cyclase
MKHSGRAPKPLSERKAPTPLVAAVLDEEIRNAMLVANRLRYVFLLLLSAVMVAFRNDRTVLPSAVALLFFWIVAIANTVVLRHAKPELGISFNYVIVVLDCAIIFAMILLQAGLSSGHADFVLALKNENYWLLLFPLIMQVLQLRIKPVIVTLILMLAIQYSLVALALADHAMLTTSFQEARMGAKIYLADALLKRPAIVVVVGLAIIYSIYRAVSMVRRIGETQQQNAALSRYFSPEIVREITTDPEVVRRGRRQKVTILFTDIRDFTRLSESIGPDELVMFLAEFRERMAKVVFDEGGSIDKFIGDAIMATFGTPKPSLVAGEDSRNAVRAALRMRESLGLLNQARMSSHLEPIRMGIGIHSGEVIAGSIGKGDLLEYSVIGDAVNTASRIENLCKTFSATLIISHDIYNELDGTMKSSLSLRQLPPTHVKGKNLALDLLAIE